ncbi:hypothetical protein [Phormidium sp. CCY1219]|jgi:hypothetical protein|uniref:hypothetical protein n=1 Tax=Phormidium sp. CCY1219 TaxID=2886104 RepID=UPI002D1EAAF6|nr:hypothetical protein [Phormidium sp. CCY1219]MEB3830475.1 hypothetical protein [Phormidium sp. CCY1219]
MAENKENKPQNVQDTTTQGGQMTQLTRRRGGPQGRPIAPNNDPKQESDLMGYLD